MKWYIVLLFIVLGICYAICAIRAVTALIRLDKKIKESEDEIIPNLNLTNSIANSVADLKVPDKAEPKIDKKPDFKLTNSMLR